MGTFRYPVSPLRPRVQPSNHEIAVQHKRMLAVKIDRNYEQIVSAISNQWKYRDLVLVATNYEHIQRRWRTNTHRLAKDIVPLHQLTVDSSATDRVLWVDLSKPTKIGVWQPLRCETCRKPSPPCVQMIALKDYMYRTIHTEHELTFFTRSLLEQLR